MFCTKCGAQLPEGVKFCTSCGAPVKTLAGMEKPAAQTPDTFVPVYAPETAEAPVGAEKKKKFMLRVLKSFSTNRDRAVRKAL
jgi:predicted amidophosphoribosyltransferase